MRKLDMDIGLLTGRHPQSYALFHRDWAAVAEEAYTRVEPLCIMWTRAATIEEGEDVVGSSITRLLFLHFLIKKIKFVPYFGATTASGVAEALEESAISFYFPRRPESSSPWNGAKRAFRIRNSVSPLKKKNANQN